MIFEQISTKNENPIKSGWYNTDKGELFWIDSEKQWSCRDDRVSEEYPSIWYKPHDRATLVQFKSVMDYINKEKICTNLEGKDLMEEFKLYKKQQETE